MTESLNAEFERDYKKVVEYDELFNANGYVTYYDVLKAHYSIVDYFSSEDEILTYGVKDFNSLGSALGRQCTEFRGQRKWQTLEENCATLFYGLIKNHPFHDANKRTALLILLYQLDKSKKTITVKSAELDKLAVNVATDDYDSYKRYKDYKKKENSQILFLSEYIRKSTRKIDKKIHPVTYHELNALLKKYDCFIEDAGKGFANIVKITKKKKLIGEREIRNKVLQIGFPGWKRQVQEKALKEVLKATKLTAENGIDSRAFFASGESLLALIDRYREPFLRLKDK